MCLLCRLHNDHDDHDDHDDGVDDEYRAVCKVRTGKGNRTNRIKCTPVILSTTNPTLPDLE
jgi:hypothetical protein